MLGSAQHKHFLERASFLETLTLRQDLIFFEQYQILKDKQVPNSSPCGYFTRLSVHVSRIEEDVGTCDFFLPFLFGTSIRARATEQSSESDCLTPAWLAFCFTAEVINHGMDRSHGTSCSDSSGLHLAKLLASLLPNDSGVWYEV